MLVRTTTMGKVSLTLGFRPPMKRYPTESHKTITFYSTRAATWGTELSSWVATGWEKRELKQPCQQINVTNLRIWQRKTVVSYPHFSFLGILKTFSFFLRLSWKHSVIFFQLERGKKITWSTCFSLFMRKIISRLLETKSIYVDHSIYTRTRTVTRIRDHDPQNCCTI